MLLSWFHIRCYGDRCAWCKCRYVVLASVLPSKSVSGSRRSVRPAIAEIAESNDFSHVVAAQKPLSDIAWPAIDLLNQLRGWPPVYGEYPPTWGQFSGSYSANLYAITRGAECPLVAEGKLSFMDTPREVRI